MIVILFLSWTCYDRHGSCNTYRYERYRKVSNYRQIENMMTSNFFFGGTHNILLVSIFSWYSCIPIGWPYGWLTKLFSLTTSLTPFLFRSLERLYSDVRLLYFFYMAFVITGSFVPEHSFFFLFLLWWPYFIGSGWRQLV